MKARMRIVRLELAQARIKPIGGTGHGTIGHQFDLRPILKVEKRTARALSGEGITCPTLQWKERIEWFDGGPPVLGGHRISAAKSSRVTIGSHRTSSAGDTVPWRYVGCLQKDMYAENPTSNTFKAWHAFRFFWAACSPPNNPPPNLAATRNEPDADKAAKHWIAAHGFQWELPELTDRPAIGLSGGSSGGGGASLVTSNTRRRVIYFDLGFSECPTRIRFVQVLESVGGVPTIHKFIAQNISKSMVDDPARLKRWRAQLTGSQNFLP